MELGVLLRWSNHAYPNMVLPRYAITIRTIGLCDLDQRRPHGYDPSFLLLSYSSALSFRKRYLGATIRTPKSAPYHIRLSAIYGY